MFQALKGKGINFLTAKTVDEDPASCKRWISIPSQQEKRENKNKIKGKQKKLGKQEWKLTAKELLKPLHLSRNRIMLQSLLAHYLFIMKE